MATIFIVNHSISGPYPQCYSSFHKTEEEAAEAFVDCKNSVGDEPALIELIALDTETLDAVTYCGWEGTHDELMEEEAALEAEAFAGHVGIPDAHVFDDDDAICEGEPLPRDGSCAI